MRTLVIRSSSDLNRAVGLVPPPPGLATALGHALLGHDAGHRITVLTLEPSLTEATGAAGALAHTIRASAAAIGRAAQDVDVVHCLDLPSGAAAVQARASTGRPVVVRAHLVGAPDGDVRWAGVLRAADGVLAPTAHGAAVACRLGVEPHRLSSCPDHAVVAAFECGSSPLGGALVRGAADTGAPFVLAVSGAPGSPATCDGLARALAAVPGLRLVVIGGGDGAALSAAAARHGVSDRVQVRGWVSGAAAIALVDAAELLVSTREDPTGALAVLVAMHRARDVVALHSAAVDDAVVDGVTGALVRPGRPHDLAAAVVQAMSDRFGRLARGMAGQDRASTRFAADIVAREVSRVWERTAAALAGV